MITAYLIPLTLLCTAWAVGNVLNMIFERIERGASLPSTGQTECRQGATTYGGVV